MQPKTTFFCGIGGSGMSAIAQVLRARGLPVAGSDRSFDQGSNQRIRDALAAQGIVLAPQDGSAIDESIGELVVSSAVEPTIPDVRAALDRHIPIVHRSELLARIFNAGDHGIAVGGTSGKSTVTAMIGHILQRLGREPTVINGAVMLGATASPLLGNVICGQAALPVIEADESDGTIAHYRPAVGVITNITLDHKPMAELRELFTGFGASCRKAFVLNADCVESASLPRPAAPVVTFGMQATNVDIRLAAVEPLADGVHCRINGQPLQMRILGLHNAMNAAAAIAAVLPLGITAGDAAAALADFVGVERRLQLLGEAGGVAVVDDFAHNPEKIAASLAALAATGRRLLVMYQPHGFGPTRFLRDGLVQAFRQGLQERDLLVMPEIFYAGGTASRDISSRDLTDAIVAGGRDARYASDRTAAGAILLAEARAGDLIVVMGARDNTLTDFARSLLQQLA